MNAPVWIAETANWLRLQSSVWGSTALLDAFFDESGTHTGAIVTGIAGYVGSKKAWEAVKTEWSAELSLLADKGVSTFHMTDCIAGTGEFARVDTFFRMALIKRLSEVLSRADIQAIWSWVITEDWAEVVTDLAFLARFPKPLDLCFEHIVRQLRDWAARSGGGERIAPMFGYSPEYYARMADIGRVYGRQTWYQEVLGPIAFGFPSQVVPLQAADFLVHLINAETHHLEYDDLSLSNLGRSLALENATAFNGMHVGGGFDANALKLTLDRFARTGEIGAV